MHRETRRQTRRNATRRQRDRERGKKSRPAVVKAPSLSSSSFFVFFLLSLSVSQPPFSCGSSFNFLLLSLSLSCFPAPVIAASLSPFGSLIHSALLPLCTRLLCGGGSKTTRVALNSIMAAVHFFLLSHTFPRIVPAVPRQTESERDGQMHADSRRKERKGKEKKKKKKIGRRERKRKAKERGE